MISPIDPEWTRWSVECATSLHPVRLAALTAALGERDIETLLPWGPAINAVAAEVAAHNGRSWPHGPDTAVAVLLREMGLMAVDDPDTLTLLGEALLVMIEAADKT